MRDCRHKLSAAALGLLLLCAGSLGACTWIVDLVPRPDPDGTVNNTNNNGNQNDGGVPDGGDAAVVVPGCVTLHDEFQVNQTYTAGDQRLVRAVAGSSDGFIYWEDASGEPASTGLTNVVALAFVFNPAAPFPGGQNEQLRYTNAESDEASPVLYPSGLYFMDQRAGDDGLEIYRADLDGTAAPFLVSAPSLQVNDQDQLAGSAVADANEPLVWRHRVNAGNTDIYYGCGANRGPVTSAGSDDAGEQSEPAIHTTGAGSGVIVWTDWNAGTHAAIRFRPVFDCAFTTASDVISSRQAGGQPGDQSQPAVGGGFSVEQDHAPFMVVWNDFTMQGPDFYDGGLRATRISQSGIPTGGEIQVNEIFDGAQRHPRVAQVRYWTGGAYTNAFLVLWESADNASGDFDIRARLFDAAGTALASEFLLSSGNVGNQLRPSIVVAADHLTALVLWEDHGGNGADSAGAAIRGRMVTFDSSGCQ